MNGTDADLLSIAGKCLFEDQRNQCLRHARPDASCVAEEKAVRLE